MAKRPLERRKLSWITARRNALLPSTVQESASASTSDGSSVSRTRTVACAQRWDVMTVGTESMEARVKPSGGAQMHRVSGT